MQLGLVSGIQQAGGATFNGTYTENGDGTITVMSLN